MFPSEPGSELIGSLFGKNVKKTSGTIILDGTVKGVREQRTPCTSFDTEVGSSVAQCVERDEDGQGGFHTLQPHGGRQAVDERLQAVDAQHLVQSLYHLFVPQAVQLHAHGALFFRERG